MVINTSSNLDLFAKDDVAPEVSASTDSDVESLKLEWKNDPINAFVRWARSANANGGKGFSTKSIVTYSSMWGKFVKFCPRNPALADGATIEKFICTLEGRVRSAKARAVGRPDPSQSRRRYLSMLDKLYEYLVRVGVRKQNDAEPLLFEMDRELRALPRPMPVALLPEEEASLLSVVDEWPCVQWRDCRDKALLALLLGSGIKVTEARFLKIQDLGLEVDPPFVKVAGSRNERLAPLNEASIHVVKEWIKKRKILNPVDDLVFLGDDQPTLSPSTIYRIVARAISKAKLSPLHTGPSVLRHTFATRQIRAGKELRNVSAWLGHEQETSTVIYKLMVVDPGGDRPV